MRAMSSIQSQFQRRRFLQGVIALPAFSSLNFGAETKAAPKRLVCVGTQLGWHKPDFFASNPEARLIKPFDQAGVGDQFTTVSGLDHKGPTGNGHALVYTLFTGQVPGSISLDQLAAPKLGADTRYESLQLSAGEIRNNAPMSLNKNGIPLPPIIRPSVLFAKVFGGKAADLKRQQYLLDSGRSLLDEVTEEARSLGSRINHSDREKLDEYLTSVRDAEKKLARRREWLDKPFPQPDSRFELPAEENVAEAMMLQNEDLMWDLMALAIKNDSCRVFSLTIPLGGSALVLGDEMMKASYHGYSHHGNKKDKVDGLIAIETEHMKGAARFMRALQDAPDTDGSSMLDNTTLLIGSAMADASKHRRVDYPLMIAGGGFRHKRHISCGKAEANQNEMACDLYVTVLQKLGFEMDQFATSQSNLNSALL